MAALPGGGADKVGNRYEAKWGVSAFLRLVKGDFDSVHIEKPGETWAEFSTEKDGFTTWYQVKLKGATAAGTIAGIKPVLSAFGPKLLSKEPCQYISGDGCEQVDELASRAAISDDFQAFKDGFLKAGSRQSNFESLGNIWESKSPDETFDRLKRLEVVTQDEKRLESHNHEVATNLLSGDAKSNTKVLFQIYFDYVHQTLSRAKLLLLLAQHGIQPLQGPDNAPKSRWQSDAQTAARRVVEKLVAIGRFGAVGPVPGSDYADWEAAAARSGLSPLPVYTDAIAAANSLCDALAEGDAQACLASVAGTLEQVDNLFDSVSHATAMVHDRWDDARTRVDELTFYEKAAHPGTDVTERVKASREYEKMRKVANERDFWIVQQDLVREIETKDLPKLKTTIAVRDN